MTFGFRVVTGTGQTVVYDNNSPAPGYVLDFFELPANATVTRDYSSSGCVELLPHSYSQWIPASRQSSGQPRVEINGMSITARNVHENANHGWGGPVFVLVMGR